MPKRPDDAAKVLVVDDEPLNRDLLRRVLAFEYDVREAGDGEAALRAVESDGPPDVLLCDHMMPGKNGTDLAREILSKWPTTVSVLLTGYDDDPDIEKARREGAIFEVLAKPWVAKQLKEALGRALSERARRKNGAA